MTSKEPATPVRWPRPRLVVSACLGFEACRHDGQVLRAGLLARLAEHAELLPVCPEVAIGLGTPRPPVRLVLERGETRLVQPSSGRDVTDVMRGFASRFLEGLGQVDGFLLKSRSPSCGPKDVRVHGSSGAPVGRGQAGVFAAAVSERFPGVAIEDEGRLTNQRVRHHFLTRVFQSARLHALPDSMAALVRFHQDSKLLLMSHSEVGMRELGRVVANGNRITLAEAAARYREGFARALSRPPRRGALVNALLHAFGHVSEALGPAERRVFLAALQRFRREQESVDGPLELLRAWNARSELGWLAGQTLFEPYPWELHVPGDSGSRARSA
jgi:uncharacterized protein YbbK (DUF523 family)/uncharacterized protein YbgA (DUF1722 family)